MNFPDKQVLRYLGLSLIGALTTEATRHREASHLHIQQHSTSVCHVAAPLAPALARTFHNSPRKSQHTRALSVTFHNRFADRTQHQSLAQHHHQTHIAYVPCPHTAWLETQSMD